MRKLPPPLILGFALAPIFLSPLRAQSPGSAPTDAKPTAASPTPQGQAPDEVMKKLSDLVHAGKYAEAQQTVAALLILYPEDQRLIKAKALLDKSPASGGPATGTAVGSSPATKMASGEPAASTKGEPLAGMDKVEYTALIERARQARESTDLPQQTKLLQQFMSQSSTFLQKYPNVMMLWELRAASAISLDDPLDGYEAGQKLLALGAADSNDPNGQRLLAQLKNKGWLDEQEAAKQAKLYAPFGTWSLIVNFDAETKEHEHKISQLGEANGNYGQGLGPATVEISRSEAAIKVEDITNKNEKDVYPFLRATVADSGDIRWEGYTYLGWSPARSFEILDNNRTMRIVFSVVPTHKKTRNEPFANTDLEYTYIFVLHKN